MSNPCRQFASGTVEPFEYYCIDGVCMLPPGAAAGDVCQPNATDAGSARAETYEQHARARRRASTRPATARATDDTKQG